MLWLSAAFILLFPLQMQAIGSASDSGYIKILSRTEGATVYVDGQPVGVVPLADRVRVETGTHKVRVGVVEKTVSVAPGSVAVVDMDAQETAVTVRPISRTLFTGCIVGAAVTALAFVFGLLQALYAW